MVTQQKPVRWLQPVMIRHTITWPHQCQAQVTTPEAMEFRNRTAKTYQCALRAKVDFRGKLICLRHAKIAALDELAGEPPVEISEAK